MESATVSWSVPESDNGAAITAYTVLSSPGGSTCITTGALTYTVSGLAAGTAYTFTVRATSVEGTGPESLTSAALTPTAAAAAAPVTEPAQSRAVQFAD